ncbi:MAG: hypothetical protein A2X82_19165 [Geobacteraceae bacterium GWC2_55_20]|nr:MAG: hypothetical protein A2X82_19165 [Geobacteraceae bacterium GWC2_55_20]OGU24927.1 MAG: hypothetical protein A2X85_10675 [Geobacteraceae bacterium GWF2_54_21]
MVLSIFLFGDLKNNKRRLRALNHMKLKDYRIGAAEKAAPQFIVKQFFYGVLLPNRYKQAEQCAVWDARQNRRRLEYVP